eukprot:NODE_2011_length_1013_cov_291.373695.p1 GENE.NODE_2011_length_1013_cov_291.373695~~NODE_2011_length_1013_cov_291.373695.p1  ORF type:complete len:313 (+),score=102.26 NODE_2011_length_1013_cov_291.373695:3-941(+)
MGPKLQGEVAWANYMLGVVAELQKLGVAPGPFEAYVESNVPLGAGVSSSAALELATARLLGRLFPETVGALDQLAIVKVCKAAENNFVGMGCGILDQFSSSYGNAGSLIFLDCRTLEHSYVPLTGGEFVLANTHAPHQLVDGKYNELREKSFEAVAQIRERTGNASITHLRDVPVELFEEHANALTSLSRKRAKHIVYENDRVQRVLEPLRQGNLVPLGAAMNASHTSSRDDFCNSCPELDQMAEAAAGLPGLLGSRLMGGGFGGCTINLVEAGKGQAFATELSKAYEASTGVAPTMLVCSPGGGAFAEDLS